MKHLICFLLAFVQLDGFSQETKPQKIDFKAQGWIVYTKPDTIRAICLITTRPNGIARARMGFVVIEQGRQLVYLDCRKRALKLPEVGWDFREVNPNYKK